jgi:hypothetical protein
MCPKESHFLKPVTGVLITYVKLWKLWEGKRWVGGWVVKEVQYNFMKNRAFSVLPQKRTFHIDLKYSYVTVKYITF